MLQLFLFSLRASLLIRIIFKHMIPIIPGDLNVTSNSTVCSVCESAYNNINDFFLRLTQGKTNQGICMDIVDTVRRKYFSNLRCF